ncbi:sperm-specific sodium:proton exchanger-like [Babylonia areolata]|uniref:sperm-specific sodium:proton exchanger-like n=1 Tax=Babylonia areolata TaxID=304850 RepID=UPI003FCF547E
MALMLLMTAVVVKLLFYSEWSYYKSIIFGIIVSATDPIAVDDAVKVTGVSVDLAALLKGESIVGGATGMICLKLFRLLQILDNSSDSDAYKQGITLFAVQCLFAPMYGIIAAIMTVFWVSRIYNDTTLEITIVLSVVHLVYYTSELLRLPGMLTVLFYGLYLSSSRASISHTVESTMKKTFQVLTDIHNSVLFFYAGVFMVMDGFTNFDPRDVLNYILIWAIVNITRVIMVFFVSPVLRRLGLGMSWEHALTVWVAGLNGVFNILLALMSTHDLRTINDERAEDSAQVRQSV